MQFLHPAVVARAVAALAAVAVATTAAPRPRPDPEPTYFACRLTRSGDFGRISYGMNVPVDGSARFHSINWQTRSRPEGVNVAVRWSGREPIDERMDDRASALVYFRTMRRIRGYVRLEIRRAAGDGDPAQTVHAGTFSRSVGRRRDVLRDVAARVTWGELKAWASDGEPLTFAIVQQDGTVVAEDRLDGSALAGADAAIAAVRPEVEAMAADYRQRCDLPGTIIVS